jgi:anti-sigma factor RsiW
MKCREFKSNHVGFVDDLLSAADMSEMRRHLHSCPSCATLDTRIRRSLLVVRNLPPIEPSADFFFRLTEALKQAPPPEAQRRIPTVAAVTALTAALAAAVYFTMALTGALHRSAPIRPASATTASAVPRTLQMNEATIGAAVPAGVPMWPAMFMVGELPTHLANAELLDTSLGR